MEDDTFAGLEKGLGSEDLPKDEVIAKLENENKKLTEKLNLTIFFGVLGLFIIINIFTFGSMETWAAPLCISALQIIVLLVLSEKCSISIIKNLITEIVEFLRQKSEK